MAKPLLVVEGPDDQAAVGSLLQLHELRYDFRKGTTTLPKVEISGGVDALLAGLGRAVKFSEGPAIGFVVDADPAFGVRSRWDAVRTALAKIGMRAPSQIPEQGFIGDAPAPGVRVGVWIMPNNRDTGGLEAFLRTLVAEGDPVIAHAEASTDEAKMLGAEYKGVHRPKAVLHAWLAWQEEPGKPYGQAVAARYFKHNSPAADAFVAWFRNLYNV